MTDKDLLDHYVSLANALGQTFAPFVEVIVHDLRQPESSIIAIRNGHITGRKVGDGTSDIGLKRLNNSVPDDLINYSNTSPHGRPLKSTSIAIRNGCGDLIGAFSVNVDLGYFSGFSQMLSQFMATESVTGIEEDESFFYTASQHSVDTWIDRLLSERQWSIDHLGRSDMHALVLALEDEGVFTIKGSISHTAKRLGVTRATIYNIIKKENSHGD